MPESRFVQEYRNKKANYEKLVSSLRSILEEILPKSDIHYQAIQGRAKSVDSLRDNIKKRKYTPLSKLDDIPDLAACRIIFYSQEDLENALKLLSREFSEEEIKDKMYGPGGYKGVHFIGTLGEKRKGLSEYSETSDLKFEIQLTTVFAHGWNEWEHDIFYKDKAGVKKDYPGQFQALKKIADGISERLKEAQDAWEDIKEQYKQAAQGKGIFSPGVFRQLAQSNSNNEIYNFFYNLDNSVEKVGALPESLKIEDIQASLIAVLEKAKENKVIPEKTIFGTLPGKSFDDIIPVVLKLLKHLSYKGLDKITDLLLELYPLQNEAVKIKIEEWFKEIAKYRYHTLKEQGYIVQGYFLDLFLKWDKEKRKRFVGILCAVGDSIFSPNFEGSSTEDYKTITFQRGGLGNDGNIRKIRENLIDLLFKAYKETESTQQKLDILETLNKALQPSHYGDSGIREVVKENAKSILKFYCKILPIASLKEITEMEESVVWTEKRFEKDEFQEIENFWILLRENKEYEIYRNLVGYDRTFRAKDSISYEEAEKARKEKVNSFVQEIDNKSINEWKARILNISKEPLEGAEIGEYHYFRTFLREIGKEKEDLAWLLLSNNRLKLFREDIIGGLLLNKRAKVRSKISRYVSQSLKAGKYLHEIALGHWIADNLDQAVYKKILEKLPNKTKKEKLNTLWQLLRVFNFKKKNKILILETLRQLNKIGYYEWAQLYYQQSEKKSEDFFESLSKKEWDTVLESLVNTRSIDYHEEYILEHLIKKDSLAFVKVFEKRIGREKRDRNGRRFEAIPYRLHYLTEEKTQALTENNKPIINEVLRWYENKENGWMAGLFLKTLFRGSDKYLEEKLNELIDQGDKDVWIKYVYPYLRWREGSDIEDLVKRTILKLPKDKEVWSACMTYLLNPGSLSGNIDDPIFANAYREKKEMILKWRSRDKKLKEFKDECIKYLDKIIPREEADHKRTLGALKRRYPKASDPE